MVRNTDINEKITYSSLSRSIRFPGSASPLVPSSSTSPFRKNVLQRGAARRFPPFLLSSPPPLHLAAPQPLLSRRCCTWRRGAARAGPAARGTPKRFILSRAESGRKPELNRDVLYLLNLQT